MQNMVYQHLHFLTYRYEPMICYNIIILEIGSPQIPTKLLMRALFAITMS